MDAATLDIAAGAVASALLHSVWQGALGAALAAASLHLLREAAPQARYAVACVTLTAVLGAWMVTAAKSAASAMATPAAASAAALPLLGPGPFDFSPAVRILPSAEEDAPIWSSWSARLERWSTAAVPLWLIGVALLSSRLVISWLSLQRLRRRRSLPVAPDVHARVVRLARQMRIARPVRVVESVVVQVPAVVGWLRPLLLLPASAIAGLTPAQLDAVIAHELAHIRRHDYAVNLLQSVAETLLFYHPACWWLSCRIRTEREHCCDDVAVKVCGDRLTYATALADLEALRQPQALALAATDGPLLRRVRRLMAPPPPGRGPKWAAATVPLAVLAIVIGGAVVPGAQRMPEQTRVPGMGRTIPGDRGVVEGQVVDAHTGRPIAGARVELRSTAGSELVTTDQAGRYTSRPLVPGAYSVWATALGYAAASYDGHAAAMSAQSLVAGTVTIAGAAGGAQRITMAGGLEFVAATTVDVRPGSRLFDIDVAMQATAQLSGRILDDRGRGLAGAYIQLVATRPSAAGTSPRAAVARSKADGTYRVAAPPGAYAVRSYVGTHVRPSKDQALAYVATFYPGVPSQDAAHVVRLEPGVDQYDLDFALLSVPTVVVSGTIIDPSGHGLEDVTVSLRGVPAASGQATVPLPLNARGEFSSRDVIPGTYAVDVTDPRRPERWKNPRQLLEITQEVTGLEIRAVTPATIVGRVIKDPGSSGRLNLAQTVISFLNRAEGAGMSMSAFNLEADGSFQGDVPTGTLTLSMMGPPGWVTRAIRVDGVDVFGYPLQLGPGAHEIEVVVTDRLGSLSGVVVDRRGTPLGGFDVVLFPQDETRWVFASPLVRQTRSHHNGRFELPLLPAGDYLAVATEGVPFLMIGDPSPTLRALQSIGTRLKVLDGEHTMISIRASPTPEALVRFTP